MNKAELESEIDVKDIIVLDNGTETIKVGYSGEDYPRVFIIIKKINKEKINLFIFIS